MTLKKNAPSRDGRRYVIGMPPGGRRCAATRHPLPWILAPVMRTGQWRSRLNRVRTLVLAIAMTVAQTVDYLDAPMIRLI
jgi:hypothetical protein